MAMLFRLGQIVNDSLPLQMPCQRLPPAAFLVWRFVRFRPAPASPSRSSSSSPAADSPSALRACQAASNSASALDNCSLLRLRCAQQFAQQTLILVLLGQRTIHCSARSTTILRSVSDFHPVLAPTRKHKQVSLLDRLIPNPMGNRRRAAVLSRYLTKVAQLGGYLARRSDSPPGNMVMWRGLSRLTDIELGSLMGAKLVGN